MILDAPSAAAFSPPPAIIEQAHRQAGASAPRARSRLEAETRSSSNDTPTVVLSEAASPSAEIAARVRLLRIESYSEGFPFSEASLTDFLAFQRENSPRKRPAIFVNDHGNIRAVWRTGEEQIGLQFLGNREVQFVVFSTRPRSKSSINRFAGNIGQDDVMGFARAAGIQHLFCA
jgi:hypothetical protein